MSEIPIVAFGEIGLGVFLILLVLSGSIISWRIHGNMPPGIDPIFVSAAAP
jgi:hypothetical protein